MAETTSEPPTIPLVCVCLADTASADLKLGIGAVLLLDSVSERRLDVAALISMWCALVESTIREDLHEISSMG